MLLRHDVTGPWAWEDGGGGCPESEDLPPAAQTEPLVEGRIRVSPLARCSRGSCSRPRRRRSRRQRPAGRVPGDCPGRQRRRGGQGSPDADRLALADRDRGSVRRSAPACRSSRSTTTRTTRRTHRTRSSPATRRTPRRSPAYNPDLVVVSNDVDGIVEALGKLDDPGAARAGGRQPRAGLRRRSSQLGKATGHGVAGGDGRGRDEALSSRRSSQSVPKSNRRLTVYDELDPTYYSATSKTFIGRIFTLLGLKEHRRRRRQDRLRVPAALGRVHRRGEPRPDRARRHRLLRPVGDDGRGPARAGARSRPSSTGASSPSTTTSPPAGGRGSSTSPEPSPPPRARASAASVAVTAITAEASGRDAIRRAARPRARLPRPSLVIAGAFLVGRGPRRARRRPGRHRRDGRSSSRRSRTCRCCTCTRPSRPIDEAILWQLRAPRVVLAALVGGMLALAGASYQGVFRNPLADPYLLGVAAGAGLGATIAIAYAASVGRLVRPAPARRLRRRRSRRSAATYVLGRSAGAGRSGRRACPRRASRSCASSPRCRRSSSSSTPSRCRRSTLDPRRLSTATAGTRSRWSPPYVAVERDRDPRSTGACSTCSASATRRQRASASTSRARPAASSSSPRPSAPPPRSPSAG